MIPKIVHVTWKTKNILNSDSPLIVNGIKSLIRLNPDWKVIVYDDGDIDYYLHQMLADADYAKIRNEHAVVKSDLWRLFKMYVDGGCYVDLDRLCNIPFNSFLSDNIKWVVPTCLDYDFSHDFMMSEPYNPVFKIAADLVIQRRREGFTSTYYLGPQTYMHAITKLLCGQVFDTDPGKEVMNNLRNIMNKNSWIYTCREVPPLDTIIYKSNENIDHEKLKRQLYKDTGLKHWTGEW